MQNEGLRANFSVLLETGVFADARVICFDDGLDNNDNERVEIPVHKRILAARSKMFSNGTDGDQMEIHDLSADIVRSMLSYIYSGDRSELDGMKKNTFYKAFHRLGVDIIKSERIQKKICVDNFPMTFAHSTTDNATWDWAPISGQDKRTVFPGSSFRTLSQNWSIELVLQRPKWGSGDKSHFDLAFKKSPYPNSSTNDNNDDDNLPIFVDLSLFILDSAYQELHEVSLGLLRCTPSPEGCTAVWKNCLDYEEILRKRQLVLLPATVYKEEFRLRLILRFEATIIIERGRYHPNENKQNSLQEADLVQHFLSLLETGVDSDARLVCFEGYPSGGNNEKEREKQKRIDFPVHKGILAARSKFFAAAFSSDFVEAKTGSLEIRDFQPKTVRAMLRFIYTGTIPDSEEMDMVELYQLGHLYDIDGLAVKCSMEFKPSVQNCCLFLNLAELYEDGALKERALHFFTINRKAVKVTEGYAQLKSYGKCVGIAGKKHREVVNEATDWFRQLITDQKDDDDEEIEELRWLIEDQLRVCNEEEEDNNSDDEEETETEEEEATDRLFE